jgi:Tol biopolymer transport system component
MNLNGKEKVVFVREESDGHRHIMMVNIDGTDAKDIVNSTGNDWLP